MHVIVPQLTKVKVPMTPKLIETSPINIANTNKAMRLGCLGLEGAARIDQVIFALDGYLEGTTLTARFLSEDPSKLYLDRLPF
jgi:hypothetical protein